MGDWDSMHAVHRVGRIDIAGALGAVERACGITLNRDKTMTTDKKLIEHETRISRMEGIIEEIRTRLTGMEAGQRELGRKIDSVKHTIWVGLPFIIGLLSKMAFFN